MLSPPAHLSSRIIYSITNDRRNQVDKFYVISALFLVITTSVSFTLLTVATVKTNDFAKLGPAAANAAVALSFLVAALSVIAFALLCRVKGSDSVLECESTVKMGKMDVHPVYHSPYLCVMSGFRSILP